MTLLKKILKIYKFKLYKKTFSFKTSLTRWLMGIDYYNCAGKNCERIINDHEDSYSCMTVYNADCKELGRIFCDECADKYSSNCAASGITSIIVKNEYKVPSFKEFESIFPRDIYNIIVKYLEYGLHFFEELDQKKYIKLQQLMYRSTKCSLIIYDENTLESLKEQDEVIVLKNMDTVISNYTSAEELAKIRSLDMATTIRPLPLMTSEEDDVDDEDNSNEDYEGEDDGEGDKPDDNDDKVNNVKDDAKSNVKNVKIGGFEKFKLLEHTWNIMLPCVLKGDEDEKEFATMQNVARFEKLVINFLKRGQNRDAMDDEPVYFEIPTRVTKMSEQLQVKIRQLKNELKTLQKTDNDIKQGNDYLFATWVDKSANKKSTSKKRKSNDEINNLNSKDNSNVDNSSMAKKQKS